MITPNDIKQTLIASIGQVDKNADIQQLNEFLERASANLFVMLTTKLEGIIEAPIPITGTSSAGPFSGFINTPIKVKLI
jgi:hypothetical protein